MSEQRGGREERRREEEKEEEEEGKEDKEEAGEPQKVRTPHKDVGNNCLYYFEGSLLRVECGPKTTF